MVTMKIPANAVCSCLPQCHSTLAERRTTSKCHIRACNRATLLLPRCLRSSAASISTPTLQCAGVLARALRGAWRPHMRGLVEPMIMTGLTDALVRALRVSLEPSLNAASMVY